MRSRRMSTSSLGERDTSTIEQIVQSPLLRGELAGRAHAAQQWSGGVAPAIFRLTQRSKNVIFVNCGELAHDGAISKVDLLDQYYRRYLQYHFCVSTRRFVTIEAMTPGDVSSDEGIGGSNAGGARHPSRCRSADDHPVGIGGVPHRSPIPIGAASRPWRSANAIPIRWRTWPARSTRT